MWISKKKWEEMENKLIDLEVALNYHKEKIMDLEDELNQLSLCHVRVGDSCGRNYAYQYTHKDTIPTDTIPDLTLIELAQYVIDHKPIKRTETHDKLFL